MALLGRCASVEVRTAHRLLEAAAPPLPTWPDPVDSVQLHFFQNKVTPRATAVRLGGRVRPQYCRVTSSAPHGTKRTGRRPSPACRTSLRSINRGSRPPHAWQRAGCSGQSGPGCRGSIYLQKAHSAADTRLTGKVSRCLVPRRYYESSALNRPKKERAIFLRQVWSPFLRST